MTSDQIYPERETVREKRDGVGGFLGSTVHLTLMPIKQTELDWNEGKRERAQRRKEESDRRMRRESTDRKRRERDVLLQCSLYEDRDQVLYQNKTRIPAVWHTLRLKQNSIFTWGKTDITTEGAKDVRACHSLRENRWNKTRSWTVLLLLLQPSPLLLHLFVHLCLLSFIFLYSLIISLN